MKIADFLISVIRGMGITQGFSLVGGMSMHINRAAGSALQIVYCHHEQAAVAAADGYAKAADFCTPGLAIVTSGPGVANVVNSIASAYYDSVPLILISGQVKTTDINRFGVRSYGPQEIPHSEILQPLTKLTFSYHPESVSNDHLARNLALAMLGRKGPIHIDISLDVQVLDVKSEEDIDEVISIYNQTLLDELSSTATLPRDLFEGIKKAKRPLLVLGNALKIASVPEQKVRKVIQHLGFPVLLTWASMDMLEYDHPLIFGCAGGLAGVHSNKILQSADLIVFLGVRLDQLTTGFNPPNFGKSARRYVIDCDVAEIEKLSGIDGVNCLLMDVRAAIGLLLDTPTLDCTLMYDWLSECREWQQENQKAEDNEFAARRLNAYHVSSLISSAEQLSYVVPTASGFAIEGVARFYKAKRGSRFSWAGHVLGSMGLALPSAIGASARLRRCVCCIDGDGGFLLNIQELYTLRANPQLAIAIFILNNGGYASISQSQSRAFGREYGASLSSGLAEVDFELIAKMANLKYYSCRSYDEFKNTIENIRDDSRILVNVFLDDDNYRGPTIRTLFDETGRPYSTPLEEVSWR
jgi:acetolactate synthase-1/2/3 large subunit